MCSDGRKYVQLQNLNSFLFHSFCCYVRFAAALGSLSCCMTQVQPGVSCRTDGSTFDS